MNNKDKKRLIIYSATIIAICFVFVFLFSVNFIGYSVKEKCSLAQEKYEGDCVEALMAYLDDESNDFSSRNLAIWALGQLGDERSLPILKKYYTGYEGGRSNRSEELAQLELKRAIGYMEGNSNITTFFWRFGRGIDK